MRMKTNRLSSVLRVIPLAIILAAATILGVMWLLGGMTRISAWYLLQQVLPVAGLVGIVFCVVRLVVRRRFDRVTGVTGLAALFALAPALLMFFPVAYPASLENTAPAATVRLPADVPLQVIWGGDRLEVNQHAVVPDQRWAYDFLVEPYFSGSPTLSDYGCYGVPVVAPASGMVTTAHDGEPDMVPGVSSNNYTAPEGNYVVILLDETETYLVLAHLRPGSVAVSTGQRVDEGQMVGECGNSGNTSEPHIHIHHQRQDPAEYPINFAEGLPLYFRDHTGPAMPEGGFKLVDGAPVATGPILTHRKEP